MKVRISPLTAAMAVISVFTGSARLLITTYAVMTAHELAHLCAAKAIGLRAESIEFAPFGVHLRLKNKLVRSLSDEIILYAAGPLVNGAAALVSLRLGYERMYEINMALFVMNLLPVLPLDGGVICRRILSYRFGSAAARRILTVTSVILAAAFACAAAAELLGGGMDLSLAAMALFLLGNAITSKEKYDVDFITAAAGAKKRSNRVRMVVVDNAHSIPEAARSVSPSCTTIAAVTDEQGRVTKLLSEKELLEMRSVVE